MTLRWTSVAPVLAVALGACGRTAPTPDECHAPPERPLNRVVRTIELPPDWEGWRLVAADHSDDVMLVARSATVENLIGVFAPRGTSLVRIGEFSGWYAVLVRPSGDHPWLAAGISPQSDREAILEVRQWTDSGWTEMPELRGGMTCIFLERLPGGDVLAAWVDGAWDYSSKAPPLLRTARLSPGEEQWRQGPAIAYGERPFHSSPFRCPSFAVTERERLWGVAYRTVNEGGSPAVHRHVSFVMAMEEDRWTDVAQFPDAWQPLAVGRTRRPILVTRASERGYESALDLREQQLDGDWKRARLPSILGDAPHHFLSDLAADPCGEPIVSATAWDVRTDERAYSTLLRENGRWREILASRNPTEELYANVRIGVDGRAAYLTFVSGRATRVEWRE